LLDDSKYVNVTGLLYLCGGWLVCVEYLNCYGCCRRLEQLWSGNTLKL